MLFNKIAPAAALLAVLAPAAFAQVELTPDSETAREAQNTDVGTLTAEPNLPLATTNTTPFAIQFVGDALITLDSTGSLSYEVQFFSVNDTNVIGDPNITLEWDFDVQVLAGNPTYDVQVLASTGDFLGSSDGFFQAFSDQTGNNSYQGSSAPFQAFSGDTTLIGVNIRFNETTAGDQLLVTLPTDGGLRAISVVPEPTSLALLGLGGLLITRRRRQS